MPTLARHWTELGEALGLDEDKMYRKGERDRHRLCSWHQCPHYEVPTDRTLQKCGGCGEASYCSKECQRTDWRLQHRMDCVGERTGAVLLSIDPSF